MIEFVSIHYKLFDKIYWLRLMISTTKFNLEFNETLTKNNNFCEFGKSHTFYFLGICQSRMIDKLEFETLLRKFSKKNLSAHIVMVKFIVTSKIFPYLTFSISIFKTVEHVSFLTWT